MLAVVAMDLPRAIDTAVTPALTRLLTALVMTPSSCPRVLRKNHDIFDGDFVVFVGRRLDRCKILFWERDGFVLYYKRLERGRFKVPRHGETELEMTSAELAMLLDGIDFSRVTPAKLWKLSFTPFHGQVDYAASRRELKANSHSMGLP
jgi:hypothetical protein